MHRAVGIVFTTGLIISAAGLTGCGPTSTVTGNVTLDGQPLQLDSDTQGTVTFVPEQGAQVSGSIQPDGSFEIKTGRKAGCEPGEYKAIVSVNQLIPDPTGFNAPTPKSLIPRDYANLETSPLKFTVTPGNNQFEIPLKSQVQAEGAN